MARFYVSTLNLKTFLLESFGQEIRGWSCWYEKVNSKKKMDFKMVYLRIVISQVQEFQLTLYDIYTKKNMFISESFQVAVIIKKLSLS